MKTFKLSDGTEAWTGVSSVTQAKLNNYPPYLFSLCYQRHHKSIPPILNLGKVGIFISSADK